ncbi:MAG: UDP-N-acetylglucosamine 2-epimerase (non-hydrolyzing) [bacterium]|nr:UDP-N-acetylglucosamine 2-epimerase (non-hydrolyzing) [bacterium]
MKRFLLLVGARPNFMKVAPLHRALTSRGADLTLVHSGQHFSPDMSDIFFSDLQIPEPHFYLGVGPGDRVTQTRKIVTILADHFRENSYDRIVVFGDITSTAAGVMAGVQAGIPIAHVEAGLRSFHWPMAEELNRMIADHHSDLLFVTEPSGVENLRSEHIPEERIHLTGNVMIDTLRRAEPLAEKSSILTTLGLLPKTFGVLTLHRPENVDLRHTLEPLLHALGQAAERLPLVVPLHPRTKERLSTFGLSIPRSIRVIDPLGYIDMLALVKNSKAVLTDSGGLQEETYALGIPCITLRGETERPITVDFGTNEIVGCDRAKIFDAVERVCMNHWKKPILHPLWDGHASERIADILMRYEQ